MNKSIYSKYTILIFICLLFFLSFTSNYSKGINELGYVIAIGLDVGETNNLKLSLQISNPSSSSSSDSGDSSSQSSDSIIESIDCSSINSGLNLFNSYLSKELNLSHCKVLVISEELAHKGISEYIYTLMNNIEFRSDANIIISKSTANDFLMSSKPSLEQLSARYYETIPTSSDYTGYTANITFSDFFSAYLDTFTDPVAILGSTNTKSSQDSYEKETGSSNTSSKSSSDNYSIFSTTEKDSSYVAGQSPISSENTIENIGLAVFSMDKFIGELNALETICYLLINNKLETSHIRIPSPIIEGDFIDLSIKLNAKTKNTVKLINGSPYIQTEIKVVSRMTSMDKGYDTLDKKSVDLIEDYTNKYLEDNILNYLYKTSTDFKTDINSFGKYVVKDFLTWEDWTDYNWLHNYENATFNVKVTSEFKSAFLLMEG